MVDPPPFSLASFNTAPRRFQFQELRLYFSPLIPGKSQSLWHNCKGGKTEWMAKNEKI